MTNPNLASPLASPASTTTYTATITMADGSIVKNVVRVVVSPAPDARISVSGSTILCAGQQVVLTAEAGAAYLWSTGEKTRSISVSEAGAYSVLVTSAGGCSAASEEIYVEVAEAGQAQAGPDAAICAGGSTKLTATGGVSYSWYPATGLSDFRLANPVASPEETTVYTVTVTHAGGCISTDQVTVRVNPKPVVSLEGLPKNACVQDTLISLPASWPAAGVLSGPGVKDNQFSPKAAGLGTHPLTFTYTDPASGCVASAIAVITVEACPGQEIIAGDGVKIYPNPSGGLYYLDIDGSKQPIQLKVYNMGGQLVLDKAWKQLNTSGKPVLDIRQYARGVYLLQLIMKGEVIHKRIVLE
ncbi:MAG: T9SS type A sorting domain-containing protein [Adhaeribacter sp.]